MRCGHFLKNNFKQRSEKVSVCKEVCAKPYRKRRNRPLVYGVHPGTGFLGSGNNNTSVAGTKGRWEYGRG